MALSTLRSRVGDLLARSLSACATDFPCSSSARGDGVPSFVASSFCRRRETFAGLPSRRSRSGDIKALPSVCGWNRPSVCDLRASSILLVRAACCFSPHSMRPAWPRGSSPAMRLDLGFTCGLNSGLSSATSCFFCSASRSLFRDSAASCKRCECSSSSLCSLTCTRPRGFTAASTSRFSSRAESRCLCHCIEREATSSPPTRGRPLDLARRAASHDWHAAASCSSRAARIS